MKERFMFRIFDTNRNVMLYEDSKDLDMEKYYGFEEYWCAMIKMPLIAIKDFFDYGFNKEYILMQSTGLKDKNGKLIYEGDILQHPQLPHKVVCEWFQCGFWLNGYQNGAKRNLYETCKFYEIIGNIYENKELLGEK